MSELKICKKSWNADEDALLLQLVNQYGLNGHWSTISSKMGNRTGKQCRERYHNHLKPDIWKGTWTQEEDDLLNESQRTMGNQWAKIAKLLPGRSDNSVKNRWHIINRKKNQGDDAVIATVSVASKPVIPKLALGSLSSAAPVIKMPVVAEDDCDLLSFYYSHSSHSHRHVPTDSTRTNESAELGVCPGSGRRDCTTTGGFDDDFDDQDALDALLEDAGNEGMMSFHNTLSSCISELTANSLAIRSSDEDDALMTSFEDCESLSARRDVWESTIHAPDLNIDRFSEPALSFRDMDSVLDDLANGTDAGDFNAENEFPEDADLFLFDAMDEETMQNTFNNASPVVRSTDKKTQINRFVTMLQRFSGSSGNVATLAQSKSSQSIREFSPRTTPRSPMCPLAKKQRAGRTPRSPYQVMLRVI